MLSLYAINTDTKEDGYLQKSQISTSPSPTGVQLWTFCCENQLEITDCLSNIAKNEKQTQTFQSESTPLQFQTLLVCSQWTCKCPEWMTDLFSSVYNLSTVPLFIHVFLWKAWRAVEHCNLSLHTVNIMWKRVQQLPNILLFCFMFLSHGTDQIESRCKKNNPLTPALPA